MKVKIANGQCKAFHSKIIIDQQKKKKLEQTHKNTRYTF